MSLRDDLDLALALADAADELTMARYRAGDLVIETKPDMTPVTESDQAAERELRRILAERRPGDGVLGEEYGGGAAAQRLWILDPIDGTKNYVRGVPVWATLVSLTVDGTPCVGVVSAPALGRRWWAATGLGAWTRGPEGERQLQASRVSALADASLSFSDHVGWPGDRLDRLTGAAWRSRAYGDFWSHVLVAEGAVDVAAEPELAPWDIAAIVPIVHESGGRITSYDGGPVMARVDAPTSALSTNGLVHDEVVALLSD